MTFSQKSIHASIVAALQNLFLSENYINRIEFDRNYIYVHYRIDSTDSIDDDESTEGEPPIDNNTYPIIKLYVFYTSVTMFSEFPGERENTIFNTVLETLGQYLHIPDTIRLKAGEVLKVTLPDAKYSIFSKDDNYNLAKYYVQAHKYSIGNNKRYNSELYHASIQNGLMNTTILAGDLQDTLHHYLFNDPNPIRSQEVIDAIQMRGVYSYTTRLYKSEYLVITIHKLATIFPELL
jgi:hypothetical protein